MPILTAGSWRIYVLKIGLIQRYHGTAGLPGLGPTSRKLDILGVKNTGGRIGTSATSPTANPFGISRIRSLCVSTQLGLLPYRRTSRL
jgi:hypothetical protein